MKNGIALLILLGSCFCGCNNEATIQRKYKTKDEFRCVITIDKSEYSNDSSLFCEDFRKYINAKKDPFNAPAYNEQTLIYIDTILYSADHRYAAILVIEKCFSEFSNEWSYDGGVHFANKVKDSLNNGLDWKIYANHGARHILAETYEKMSEILRLNNFVYRSYEAHQKKIIGYNTDDCRFWMSDSFLKKIQPGGFVEIEAVK